MPELAGGFVGNESTAPSGSLRVVARLLSKLADDAERADDLLCKRVARKEAHDEYIREPSAGTLLATNRARMIRIARRDLEGRQRRDRFLNMKVIGEPGWNILLDLFSTERAEGEEPITSCCIASQAPATTALRYIAMLEKEGLVKLRSCEIDHRRRFVSLTKAARVALSEYFDAQIAADDRAASRFGF